ncbi:MAG TPA: hypothetical protein VGL66_03795 [Caulobacteraceae bacterium]|jgi:hypothetical protein
MTYDLTLCESALVASIGRPRPVDLGRYCRRAGITPVVRAETLRRLLLGLEVKPLGAHGRVVPIPAPGLSLVGVRIDRPVNLHGGHTHDGLPLAGLFFERCQIPALHLEGAEVRRLTLKQVHLSELNACDARILGPVSIASLHAFSKQDDGERCTCHFRGLKAGGDFTIEDADLNALTGEGGVALALDLSNAQINGSVSIGAGTTVVGGVSLKLAEVGGDVCLGGCALATLDGPVLDARGAAIGGSLLFRARSSEDGETSNIFRAIGQVSIEEVEVDGSIDFTGALIVAGELRAARAQVGGHFLIGADTDEPAARDFIRMNDGLGSAADQAVATPAWRQIYLTLDAAKVTGSLQIKGINLAFLSARNIEVGDDVTLEDCAVVYRLDLAGGTVQGNLNVRLRQMTSGRRATVDFSDLEVGALYDDDGREFGENIILKLQGFKYGSFGTKDSSVDAEAADRGDASRVRRLVRRGQAFIGPVPRFVWPLLVTAFAIAMVATWAQHGTGASVWWRLLFVLGFFVWWLSDAQTTDATADARLAWLDLQYNAGEPTRETYSPQPYERLIRAFRLDGAFEDARRVARRRLDIERKLFTPIIVQPFALAFAKLFDYGMSPVRAILVFAACLFIGAQGVAIADKGLPGYVAAWRLPNFAEQPLLSTMEPIGRSSPKGVLVLETNTVRTVAIYDNRLKRMAPAVLARADSASVDEIECGDTIEPGLYAVDAFVPALDLRQEAKCGVSTQADAAPWRWALAIYAGLGWIVTSLTVLTLSGILRRHAEG